MIKDLSVVLVILNDLLFTYSTNTVALRIPMEQPPVLVGFFFLPIYNTHNTTSSPVKRHNLLEIKCAVTMRLLTDVNPMV